MSLEVVLERLIDATPEEAFAAWSDPAARLRWYAPAEGMHVEASGDVRVGATWRAAFGSSPDELYVEEGVYREVDPPNRLVYTQRFQGPNVGPFETLVTVTFEARAGKTVLRLVDSGYPDEETRAAHENGWPAFIDQYERYLASR